MTGEGTLHEQAKWILVHVVAQLQQIAECDLPFALHFVDWKRRIQRRVRQQVEAVLHVPAGHRNAPAHQIRADARGNGTSQRFALLRQLRSGAACSALDGKPGHECRKSRVLQRLVYNAARHGDRH
jgi:hypothetical protein